MNSEVKDIEVLRERTKKRILGIQNLPSVPEMVNDISSLLSNPNTSVNELGKVLSRDQGLVTKILRVANSPLYGLPRKVSTIEFAIVILGFNHIKNIVMAMSALELLNSNNSHGWNRRDFWLHSVLTATLAKRISDDLGFRKSGEAFITGLLHDLGISIINKFFKDEYIKIYNLINEEGMDTQKAEMEVIGLTHPEIGQLLAEKWNLPDVLSQAILYHHQPSRSDDHRELAAIIHLADSITDHIKIGNLVWDSELKFDKNIIQILNLGNEENLDALIEKYESQISDQLESIIA